MTPELPLTLRPSKAKATVLFLGSAVFVVGGFLMIASEPFAGWFCVVFFGLCALVAAAQVLPNASYLRLTPQGFAVRSLFRESSLCWWDVSEFGVTVIGHNRFVGWNYCSSYPKQARLRGINVALSGFEAALPDSYGRPAAELAELLNALRGVYGASWSA
jgi:hypothetical protein